MPRMIGLGFAAQRMMPAYDPAKVSARVRAKRHRSVAESLDSALAGGGAPKWIRREIERRVPSRRKIRDGAAKERGVRYEVVRGRAARSLMAEGLCFGLNPADLGCSRFRARWQPRTTKTENCAGCEVTHRPSGLSFRADHKMTFRENRALCESELAKKVTQWSSTRCVGNGRSAKIARHRRGRVGAAERVFEAEDPHPVYRLR